MFRHALDMCFSVRTLRGYKAWHNFGEFTFHAPNLAAMSGTHGGTRNGYESQVKAPFFTRGEGGCGARFRRLG
jgi:hypothetical protein